MTSTSAKQERSEQPKDRSAVRPFRFTASEEQLVNLPRRLGATRRPEREAYRRDVPNAQVHIVDGGHSALEDFMKQKR